MKKLLFVFLISTNSLPFYSASVDHNENQKTVTGHWYTQSLITAGKNVFQRNCMACHGFSGEGITDD